MDGLFFVEKLPYIRLKQSCYDESGYSTGIEKDYFRNG